MVHLQRPHDYTQDYQRPITPPMTKVTVEQIVREFERMTPETIPSDSDDLYAINGPDAWLKAHSSEHLFDDSVYDEPMCDLSREKIKDWLRLSLTSLIEEAVKEIEAGRPKEENSPEARLWVNAAKDEDIIILKSLIK